ncbi:MAG TPA: NAD(P)-dependent oxidoreductase [Terriglobia bacterium]|nr:NAD(P)-dependent oxidoreductase [Terriglobia bacterium]
MKVGLIGLGRMGQALAARMLGDGNDLVVYNRTAEKTAETVKAGATAATSIAGACKDREVVITMVTGDPALQEVTLKAGGIRESLEPGAVHLCMGTHSVAQIKALAAAHAEARQLMVAAPVLGRPDAAAAGQLGIVAAGPESAVAMCEPLFKVMGRRVFHAGLQPEHAAITKLANNFMLGCALGAMSEGFSLVRKFGVAPQVFYEVMTESLFAAPAYKVYGKIMVDESFDKVGFTTLLALKDFNLIMAAADEARVPLPSGNAFRDRLLSAIAHGGGDKDWAIVAREQARASGIE